MLIAVVFVACMDAVASKQLVAEDFDAYWKTVMSVLQWHLLPAYDYGE